MGARLERAIASLAPSIAVKRGLARRQFRRLERSRGGLGFGGSYEASSKGRRTHHWRTGTTDANAALSGALTILRARSRDLIRNNCWGVSGVGAIDDWTVGCGIQLQPVGKDALAKEAAALWRKWGKSPRCDAEEVGNLAALQSLVMRTVVASGSALIRRRVRFGEAADGLSVPLQIQVLEPDHLDLTKTVGNDGNRVHHGVEINAYGRRVAYWLFPDHPGSSHPVAVKHSVSQRVPASEVKHVFLRTRTGQAQAAPWLTPAILKMRSLDEYEDAELLRMTIASNWAGFITTESDPDDDDDLDKIEDVEPGSFEYLRQGESIEFPTLPTVTGRDSYTAGQLRAIAAGLRVPYEALTQDLTKVNFSSGRMGFNAFERRVKVWQQHLLVMQFMEPVWAWFVEAALQARLLKPAALDLETTFTPPGRMILDPDKEGKADTEDVRNGRKTVFEVLRGRGHDPEAHLREVAESFDLLDELELTLDCDPRRTVAPGGASVASSEGEGKETQPPPASLDGAGDQGSELDSSVDEVSLD